MAKLLANFQIFRVIVNQEEHLLTRSGEPQLYDFADAPEARATLWDSSIPKASSTCTVGSWIAIALASHCQWIAGYGYVFGHVCAKDERPDEKYVRSADRRGPDEFCRKVEHLCQLRDDTRAKSLWLLHHWLVWRPANCTTNRRGLPRRIRPTACLLRFHGTSGREGEPADSFVRLSPCLIRTFGPI